MFDTPGNPKGLFCRQAGEIEIIEARLRGEGTSTELAAWQNHLTSCEECHFATQQDATLRLTFESYRSARFFEQLSSGWQPNLNSLAQYRKTSRDKDVDQSQNNAHIYILEQQAWDLPPETPHHKLKLRRQRAYPVWSLALVASLMLLAIAAFLMLVVAGVTAPASMTELAKPKIEPVWQLDGKPIGLVKPGGIALDGQGNLYIAEQNYYYIKKLDPSGQLITRWGGAGNADGQFLSPWGVAVDKKGYVYVADQENHRIQKFTLDGQFLTKWGSYGTATGQFDRPWGIAVDRQGFVYVVDSGNARIQKFDPDGSFLANWGSYGSDSGQFVAPRGIAIDALDNVYVTDATNANLQKFNTTGKFLARWESRNFGLNTFSAPFGVAVDRQGNVYITDTTSQHSYKFNFYGYLLYEWGSNGSTNSRFNSPSGIAVDEQANIYVAESGAAQIQKFRQR